MELGEEPSSVMTESCRIWPVIFYNPIRSTTLSELSLLTPRPTGAIEVAAYRGIMYPGLEYTACMYVGTP